MRAMAKDIGIAASSVVKIWHEHGLRRTAGAASNCRVTRPLRRNCMTSWGSVSALQPMPLSCPSMKEPDPGAGPDTAGTPVKEGSWWRDDDP